MSMYCVKLAMQGPVDPRVTYRSLRGGSMTQKRPRTRSPRTHQRNRQVEANYRRRSVARYTVNGDIVFGRSRIPDPTEQDRAEILRRVISSVRLGTRNVTICFIITRKRCLDHYGCWRLVTQNRRWIAKVPRIRKETLEETLIPI